jgi:hypothetical protein
MTLFEHVRFPSKLTALQVCADDMAKPPFASRSDLFESLV